MDKETTKLLMKKVKKHSKWTEGTFVNPIYWTVNGKPYYMGGFTKGGESVATAYLTIGEEVKEEALEAQQWLSLFADISKNILNASNDRLRVNPSYFTKTLAMPVSSGDPKVTEGRDAYAELWEIQQEYVQLANAYIDYYEKDVLVRGEITEADVHFTQEQANLLTVMEYRTLKALSQWNDEIQAFVAYLKTSGNLDELTKDEKYFVENIAENKENIEKNLAGLNLLIDKDLEKMIEINLERNKILNSEQIAAQRQYIRYPK